MTVSENQIAVTAQSIMDPTDVIHALVDEQGQLKNLRFEGNFK